MYFREICISGNFKEHENHFFPTLGTMSISKKEPQRNVNNFPLVTLVTLKPHFFYRGRGDYLAFRNFKYFALK